MSDVFGNETRHETLDLADELALPLIRKWEGLHRVGPDGLIYPYRDAAGYPTIGYGTLIPSMDHGPITRDQAEFLMRYRYLKAKLDAIRLSPNLVFYPEKLAAITSFIYNLGPSRYAASTLRRKVIDNNWEEAHVQIQRWVYAGGRKLRGLIARRAEEATLLWQAPTQTYQKT